ncbi:hypothetical protein MC885_016535 [Smutsia gigantea]|nr:hypothetical protein MC885_016535 [Smutsia gigantea]
MQARSSRTQHGCCPTFSWPPTSASLRARSLGPRNGDMEHFTAYSRPSSLERTWKWGGTHRLHGRRHSRWRTNGRFY